MWGSFSRRVSSTASLTRTGRSPGLQRDTVGRSRGRRFKSCRPDAANEGGTRSSSTAFAAFTSGNSDELGRRAGAEIKDEIGVAEPLGIYLGTR
jgi:hypothetical protein